VVLEAMPGRIDGEVDEASRIEGDVVIESGAVVVRSNIRGPAIIGAGCRLEDTYVGPFTSLDEGVRVVGAELEHCIVLRDARIEHLDCRIDASLIGREAHVFGSDRKPSAHRLMIGDGCRVGIGK